ncbi:arrestin domain-containing protein 3-like [Oppia nitens]|uniref:arrestin domain-containing protein 3-like n=1 Tax=Oppia nitens TaxID=1686743 RepID=UPI0023DB49F8|nr:arrestin domain-containing protein 3-like [Oppia nitens]
MSRYHITNMNIVLTDGKDKYQSGDYITGKVELILKGNLLISVINIQLYCLADVKWTELPGLKSDGHCFHVQRRYLEFNYQLPDEFRDRYFDDGINEIPFMFRLPDSGLPSTFKSPYGSINYFIEAYIGEPIIDESLRTKLAIAVESPFKDNLYLSVDGEAEKELGIVNLASGVIRMYAFIGHKGHVPGQTVELICQIDNKSTARVTPRATLYRTEIYMTGEKHKTVETILTDPFQGTEVEPGETIDSVINIPIPDDLPMSLKCPNITIKYFIHCTLDIPHTIDLHLNLPIILTNNQMLDG